MIAPPPELRAGRPAELRGLPRHGARLCVVDRDRRTVTHSVVSRIGEHLGTGDLLVVNSSRTLPGALSVRRDDGSAVQIRPAVLQPDHLDALAVDCTAQHRNVSLRIGERLRSRAGLRMSVVGRRRDVPLLWRLSVEAGDPVDALLRDGDPIRYSYVPGRVPLEHYQTVFAGRPGSVETPSAGRHLSWELLTSLRRQGVGLIDVVLHCSISSLQDDAADARKPLIEEWFEVGAAAAAMINAASRVVAVGTTVVRALESAVATTGRVLPRRGWTDCVITPATRIRTVDALLTGLHEPPATHLDMIRAFIDADLLTQAYTEARDTGYLWHEFGDAMLIL